MSAETPNPPAPGNPDIPYPAGSPNRPSGPARPPAHPPSSAPPARQPAAVMPQKIINNVPLVSVADPTGPSYRHTGKMRIPLGGKTYGGTGVLISIGGAYGIVTAAHNLYEKVVDGAIVLINGIEFIPAYNAGGVTAPYGTITLRREDMWVPNDYRPDRYTDGIENPRLYPYDYAAIRVARERIDERLLSGMPQLAEADPLLRAIQVTGFPVGEPGEYHGMYYGKGNITRTVPPNVWYYDASTEGGMSGSGVCAASDLTRILGIHDGAVPGQEANHAVRMTTEVIAAIEAWITHAD